MKNKVCSSFDEAVADVPDGATVMIGGFGPPGLPQNLLAALVRQGAKDLMLIANRVDQATVKVSGMHLVAEGRVRKIVCAFSASPHPSKKTALEQLHEDGKLDAELVPQGTMVERMRAAAAGLGAIYTPTGVGTEIAQGKECRTINGREYILEFALPADYALIRATRTDTFGNLQYHRTQRNFNPVMAMAAKTTIVEIEGEILEVGAMDPDQVHTPGIFVDHIVKIPPPPEGLWTSPSEHRALRG